MKKRIQSIAKIKFVWMLCYAIFFHSFYVFGMDDLEDHVPKNPGSVNPILDCTEPDKEDNKDKKNLQRARPPTKSRNSDNKPPKSRGYSPEKNSEKKPTLQRRLSGIFSTPHINRKTFDPTTTNESVPFLPFQVVEDSPEAPSRTNSTNSASLSSPDSLRVLDGRSSSPKTSHSSYSPKSQEGESNSPQLSISSPFPKGQKLSPQEEKKKVEQDRQQQEYADHILRRLKSSRTDSETLTVVKEIINTFPYLVNEDYLFHRLSELKKKYSKKIITFLGQFAWSRPLNLISVSPELDELAEGLLDVSLLRMPCMSYSLEPPLSKAILSLIKPKKSKADINWDDLDVAQFVQALTARDLLLFKLINPTHIRMVLEDENNPFKSEEKTFNPIKNALRLFNGTTDTVVLKLLLMEDEQKRQMLIKRLFSVTESFLQNNNFHGALQIYMAFLNPAVKEYLKENLKDKKWEKLASLFNPQDNFAAYYHCISQLPKNTDYLPVLDFLLTDIISGCKEFKKEKDFEAKTSILGKVACFSGAFSRCRLLQNPNSIIIDDYFKLVCSFQEYRKKILDLLVFHINRLTPIHVIDEKSLSFMKKQKSKGRELINLDMVDWAEKLDIPLFTQVLTFRDMHFFSCIPPADMHAYIKDENNPPDSIATLQKICDGTACILESQIVSMEEKKREYFLIQLLWVSHLSLQSNNFNLALQVSMAINGAGARCKLPEKIFKTTNWEELNKKIKLSNYCVIHSNFLENKTYVPAFSHIMKILTKAYETYETLDSPFNRAAGLEDVWNTLKIFSTPRTAQYPDNPLADAYLKLVCGFAKPPE